MVVLVMAKIGRFVENVKTVALFVKEQKGKSSVILHRDHKEHESFKLKTGKKHHQMNMKETEIALGTWAWDAGIDTRGDWEHTME